MSHSHLMLAVISNTPGSFIKKIQESMLCATYWCMMENRCRCGLCARGVAGEEDIRHKGISKHTISNCGSTVKGYFPGTLGHGKQVFLIRR